MNYDKYFRVGDSDRNMLTEFNSSNTGTETKEKIASLQYIQERLREK